MSWWQKILETIEVGDELFTPGRGMEGNRRSPFSIKEKSSNSLRVKSGNSTIKIERKCFDAIEEVFKERCYQKLRCSSLHDTEAYDNSADKVIREVTGSQLARGNYVCAILEKIGVVSYTMDADRKCIELQPNQNRDQTKTSMNYKLNVIIQKDNHGYYAFCPELEGCQSQGDSLEEVLENIREAVELYLETLSEEEIKASLSKEILTTSMEVRVG